MKATRIARRPWWIVPLALFLAMPSPAASILTPDAPTVDAPAYLGANVAILETKGATAPALQVTHVDPDGPAARILQDGDLLTALDGQALISVAQLRARLATAHPGDTLVIAWIRGESPGSGSIVLGKAISAEDALLAEPVAGDQEAPGADSLGMPHATVATDQDARVDALVDRIRESYDILPADHLESPDDVRFPDDAHRPLHAADLPLPSTNPDDYRKRKIPDLTVAGSRDTTTMGSGNGNLSLANRDGETIYTFRDPNGVVLYEGPVGSREERERIPFDVWKRYYEMEHEEMNERNRANDDD